MGDTGTLRAVLGNFTYDLGPEAAEPGRENEEFPLDGGGRRFVENLESGFSFSSTSFQ